MNVRSINPATEAVNKEFEYYTKEQVEAIVEKADAAAPGWAALNIGERAAYMRKLSDVLKRNKEEYSRLMTSEMGKTIKNARAEVDKCAWICDLYADNSARWLADEPVKTEASKSFIAFEPLGIVFAIMPWNFPFSQVFRWVIPAMMAGNACILRHSNTVPMCALAIEEAFKSAEFPDGTFAAIISDHDTVKRLIKDKRIAGVSLTGSVDAGSRVAALASKCIKRVVLELGGSDPFVVLEDADVASTAIGAKECRIAGNTGQSCIAAKRFIVVRKVADEFIKGFTDQMKAAKTGDPLDDSNEVGPLANREQLEKLEAQVNDAVSKGAKVLCGGRRIPGKGYFFEPTILTNIKPNMRAAKEEVFGPVATVFVVRDEASAIRMANKTEYGLGASIWTSDMQKAERIARAIAAGNVFVNTRVRSDPRLPFGGVKRSGVGRELSRYGLLEFVNVKTVFIK